MTQQQLDRDDYKTIANLGNYHGYNGMSYVPNPNWSAKLLEAYKNGYDGGVWEHQQDTRED